MLSQLMYKVLCVQGIQTNPDLVVDEDSIVFNDNQSTCEVKWNFK